MRHHPVFLASPTSVSHRFGEGTVIGVCQHRLDRSRLAAHLRQGENCSLRVCYFPPKVGQGGPVADYYLPPPAGIDRVPG